MSSPFQIPLIASPQTLSISMAGVVYQLTVKWNVATGSWVLDIADNSGNPIISGIPIVTGEDLLSPFGYLNFGGKLIAQTDNDVDAVPTFENLGSSGNLFFVVG